MLLRKSVDPNSILRAGMLFLVVASLSLRFLPRVPHLSPDLADGISGLFYGVAIATLLSSIVARRRRASGEE